jgi:hypothetical protein
MAEKFKSIYCEWSDDKGTVLFDPGFADHLSQSYGPFSLRVGQKPDDLARIAYTINGVTRETPLRARLQEVDGMVVVSAPVKTSSTLPTRSSDGNVGFVKKLATAMQLAVNLTQEKI